MREFTFDKAPIKFVINAIQQERIEIVSVADIGNIVFNISAKSGTFAEVHSKYDLEISHLKFIALVDQKDYRVAAMDSYIINDEKTAMLIDCLHILTDENESEETKSKAERVISVSINAFYNAFVREIEERRQRRERGRDRNAGNDREETKTDRQSARADRLYAEMKNPELLSENAGDESQNSPRKKRLAQPQPKSKNLKPKPVRVRTTRPKLSE